MDIQRVYGVYWSATGNTEKAVRAVGEGAAETLSAPFIPARFTLPGDRGEVRTFGPGDLVVVGSPTYAGKLPNKILPDLQTRLTGNGALAAAVVTYGNRSFDNALAELWALLTAGGFHPAGGAALVGRHAFTDALGYGRPDLSGAGAFGKALGEKVLSLVGPPGPISIPGEAEAPYYVPKGLDGQPAKFLKARPQTDLGKCTGCGACARTCPMGAIDPENPALVPGTCIKCCSCVRKCVKGAKFFDDSAFLSHVAMLERDFGGEVKEDAFFL